MNTQKLLVGSILILSFFQELAILTRAQQQAITSHRNKMIARYYNIKRHGFTPQDATTMMEQISSYYNTTIPASYPDSIVEAQSLYDSPDMVAILDELRENVNRPELLAPIIESRQKLAEYKARQLKRKLEIKTRARKAVTKQASRHTTWQTRTGDITDITIPAGSAVWNYRYGQFEVGLDAAGAFTFELQPEGGAPYGSSCAAMATAAVILIGTRLHGRSIANIKAGSMASLMHDILALGAQAYDHTSKGPVYQTDEDSLDYGKPIESQYAEAGDVLVALEQLNLAPHAHASWDLQIQFSQYCFTSVPAIPDDQYTPETPLRNLLTTLELQVQSDPSLFATGVVLSDGSTSRSIVYLRGNPAETGFFALYDSHTSFFPDLMQRQEQNDVFMGSHIALAPTIDDIIHIAHLDGDGNWPVNAPDKDQLPRHLLSTVFIEITAPRPASTAPAPVQPHQTPPPHISEPASPAPHRHAPPHK